ncbi:unnamed protein product [Lathyrus oleraceus]
MRSHIFFWLFFIPFSLTNSSTYNFAANDYCLDHEHSLLLHMKNNLIFNPMKSSKLVHWNQSDEDCCQWHGVTCNDGHVTSLDLSHESVSEGLNDSSALFSLQYLQSLNLAFNDFHSMIPQELHQLQNLRYLNLSNAGFEGQVPTEISHLTKLVTLDLSSSITSNHSLKLENPNIEMLVESLTDITELYLDGVAISSSGDEWARALSLLKGLRVLSMSSCNLSGPIDSSLAKLTQLIYIDLSSNNLTGPLPSFNRSKNLTYISFFLNHLSGELPSDHFEGLSNLVSIDLGFNSFNGSVPPSVLKLPYLRELKLPYNQLSGVLGEFDNASSSVLEILDLTSNNLEGPIPLSVFNLKTLSFVQLSYNKFNGTIKLDLIRRLTNLTILGLSHNNLFIDVNFKYDHDLSPFPKMRILLLDSCKIREIPSFLRNQSTLLSIHLSENKIEGLIPSWIWQLDSLITLNLSRNNLTGLEGSDLNFSSNLIMGDFSYNQLQGPISFIPKYAIYLDYSSNRFSSFVPPDIGNHLPYIRMLFLSNNNFSGQIHESFCNASTLNLLDLSHNNFVGTIPKCFSALSSSLKMLNLGGNKLRGHIPSTMFQNSCALRFLNLNDNLLGSTIPKSLVNCQELQVLNLGKNALTGKFPCFSSKISTLRVMILRSNKFHGSIECPKCIGEWEMLHIADLASNNFSGKLSAALLNRWKAMMRDEAELGPEFGHLFLDIVDIFQPTRFKDVLQNLNKRLSMKVATLVANMPRSILDQAYVDGNTILADLARYQDSIIIVNKGQQMKLVKIQSAFTYIDMSNNYLEGPIPNELMQFKALNALNLSHNAFLGHIPSSVWNLKNLESMDLSNNSLNGEIPRELSSLSFLDYMNLSFNHLAGEIPLGTQIQSFDVDSFKGNEGLCGPPLTNKCDDDGMQGLPPAASETPHSQNESSIDWSFLSMELGLIFGFGIFILPVICMNKLRLWYFKHVDEMLYRFIPCLDFVYEQHEGKRYRTLSLRY